MQGDLSRAFRDLQVKNMLATEKEKSLVARRAALAELRLQVQAAQSECDQRQAPLTAEMARLNAAKDEYACARAERDRAARAQQQRLAELRQEEARLQQHASALEQAVMTGTERINMARQDAALIDETDNRIAALQERLSKEEQAVTVFEERLRSAEEAAAARRRGSSKLSQLHLPSDTNSIPVTDAVTTTTAQTSACDATDALLPGGATIVFFDED